MREGLSASRCCNGLGSVRQWVNGDGYAIWSGGYTPLGVEMWGERSGEEVGGGRSRQYAA